MKKIFLNELYNYYWAKTHAWRPAFLGSTPDLSLRPSVAPPQLSKSFPGFRAPLPPKGWLRQFQHDFLDKRRAGLQTFLDQILGHAEIAQSPIVKEFLCLDGVSDSAMDNDPEVSCFCTARQSFSPSLYLSLPSSLISPDGFAFGAESFAHQLGNLGPSIGKKFGHGILCALVSEIRRRGRLPGAATDFFFTVSARPFCAARWALFMTRFEPRTASQMPVTLATAPRQHPAFLLS